MVQGTDTQWAGCEVSGCDKWRVVDSDTIRRVEGGASYTCSTDKGRPIRGCLESWNREDDEPLLTEAKAAVMF